MEAAALFLFLIILLMILVFSLGFYLLTSFIYKKVIEKDSRNGWYGFIPVYRDYVLIEMSGLAWYWIVALYVTIIVGIIISIIPFVGSIGYGALMLLSRIAAVNMYIYLCKRFHAEDWLIIVTALFPIIGLGILGFSSKYAYDKTVEVEPDGFLGDLGIASNGDVNPNTTTAVAPVVKEEPKEEEKEEKVEKPKKTTKKTKKEE